MKLTVNIEKLAIHHASDIYEIMQLILKREKKLNTAKEHFWVIALNNANKILNLELVSIGSTSNTIVKPMEVLSIPLQKRAVGVILVHNHPSNRPEPSEEDKDLTDRLIQACKLMNTPVLDHVIITENSYYSFKSSGLLDRLGASNKYVLPYELEKQFHEEMQEELKRMEKENKKKIKESFEKGLKQGADHIAKQMLQDGTPIEHIVKWTGLSKQEVEDIKKNRC
jgi:DNA repair protein RadC